MFGYRAPISTSNRPSASSSPNVKAVPNWARSPGIAMGSIRTVARTVVRRSSIVATTSCHVAARSKSGGRSTGSSVTSTDCTRLSRNVRMPASVPATRYHTEPFSTRPRG